MIIKSFSLALLFSSATAASVLESAQCQKITQDTERLHCYDRLFAQPKTEQTIAVPLIVNEPSSQLAISEYVTAKGLSTYRPNYFLFYSYNLNRDTNLYPVSDLSYELDRPEAKFQISFKGPIWLDILGSNVELWFGYTQVSFWQWFNTDLSSPFRESNYEPEAWLEYDLDYELYDGWKLTNIAAGGNHQSNGQEELLSRSWNRVMASVNFDKQIDSNQQININIKTWKRVSEEFDDDDNPDISRFMGHAELTTVYRYHRHEFSLMLRNMTSSRRGINFNWSFPIGSSSHVKGYFQLFNGYGESLIDYNHYNQSIGIGFSISDWL
ncbi:MAG: phospholipase A [Gammaproteobacteria bacterium]|nr:phospholipase A [Gammaproteobacteria bacterium]